MANGVVNIYIDGVLAESHKLSPTFSQGDVTRFATRAGTVVIDWTSLTSDGVSYGSATATPGDSFRLARIWGFNRSTYHGETLNRPYDDTYNPHDFVIGSNDLYDYQAEYNVNFETLQTATITYDANGGLNAPQPQTMLIGRQTAVTREVPTRAGYVCIGWSAYQDGSGRVVAPGELVTIYSDVTWYAVWSLAIPGIILRSAESGVILRSAESGVILRGGGV